MMATDALLIALALWLALSLRYGLIWFVPTLPNVIVFISAVVSALSGFWVFGLYRWMVRYLSSHTFSAIMRAAAISGLVVGTVEMFLRAELPRSTPVIYVIVLFLLVGASRWVAQHYLRGVVAKVRRPVAIYGAGESGRQLALALHQSDDYRPVLFIDDKPSLHGMMVYGLRVYHPRMLPSLVENFGIEQILLAMPSVGVSRRREILSSLEPLSLKVRTVPGMSDIVSGNARVDQIRDINVEDVLGRDQVPPHMDMMEACVRDRVVMVTGAGGSIGSELCRQLLFCRPRSLVLFEISEYALYMIDQELRDRAAQLGVGLIPCLGNVQDADALKALMGDLHVDTVYHAAAYKHVPLVEKNVVEGIRNNVFGTLRVADAALAANVSNFVLISTDKAVRPTNMMGATKRLAELILQALSTGSSKTCFSIVRFGNVLGSSGSVVPLFTEQIRSGGPVTVTHPDVIRYFMTIPEAAQLVIQAGAMAEGGDVFLLDMGEPVRIADLARKMVHLMGYAVREGGMDEEGIEIKFSGLRPGEKLYEELLVGDNAKPTLHPRILRAEEQMMSWDEVDASLNRLSSLIDEADLGEILAFLKSLPLGYQPGKHLTARATDPGADPCDQAQAVRAF